MSYGKVIALIASLAVIVMLSNVRSSEAAVFTQRAVLHPAHPGRCYDKLSHRAMLPNKEYKPKGICAALTCDLGKQVINIETCPYVEAPGCEELPPNPNLSFPKCCAQFKCIDFKTGKEVIISV